MFHVESTNKNEPVSSIFELPLEIQFNTGIDASPSLTTNPSTTLARYWEREVESKRIERTPNERIKRTSTKDTKDTKNIPDNIPESTNIQHQRFDNPKWIWIFPVFSVNFRILFSSLDYAKRNIDGYLISFNLSSSRVARAQWNISATADVSAMQIKPVRNTTDWRNGFSKSKVHTR